ncbi:MAG: DUF1318 domain-containing protein [Zetaproteobacteria bacterium]|nr:MAG: DUF1318 domain-containing protein [Zetaproteobacteria bacterium]
MACKKRWLVGLSMVLLVSCVTVNIYFPAAAIQKAADQIVDDVRQTPEQAPEQKPEPTPDKKSHLGWLQYVTIGAPTAHAAAVDVNVSTPAIRALKASMANRFPQLQPLYGKGALGETNTGLVAVRDTGALSLKERADVSRLVDEENRYRTAAYTEIVKANNLGMNTLPEVQKLFANSWRGKSASGWWIQQDNGQWAKK